MMSNDLRDSEVLNNRDRIGVPKMMLVCDCVIPEVSSLKPDCHLIVLRQ